MKQLKDWIRERRTSHFVGRTRELQLMKERLVYPQEEWSLLHFCGHSGAGKTALLQRFERMTIDVPVLYMSGQSGFDAPELFLEQIGHQLEEKSLVGSPLPHAEVTDAVNGIAETRGGLALLLDDLDQWITIEGWLQEEWFPSLSTKVRICSAGRAPLVNVRPPLWEELVVNEPLLPYAPSPSRRETDAESSECLEAAAILKFFDHPLLENILKRPVPPRQFEALCRSPHVAPAGKLGWYVADDLRRKLRMKCKTDSPIKYLIYKQRAESALDERLRQFSPERYWYEHELAWRKFSLLDNDFLQGIVFCGNDEGFTHRLAVESELPVLERMLSYNIDTLQPYKIDDVQMHSYVSKIWNVAPDAVYVVHRYERLAGLYFLIRLNDETREVLAHNPITQSFIELGSAEDDDYFVYTVASIPAFDFAIFGHILRKLLYTELVGRRLTFLLPMRDQMEAFGQIGFEHLEWSKYQSSGGLTMYFVQLDLRAPVPFPVLYSEQGLLLEPLADHSSRIAEEILYPVQPDRDLKTWEPLVKHLLDNYKDIQSPKIKEIILLAYRRLKSGSGAEQTQAQILQHRYLQKKGSHEGIASLLFLPIATYYRHLRRLIVTLAQSLRAEFFREQEVRSQIGTIQTDEER